MAGSYTSKRVIFRKGEQKIFLCNAQKCLNLPFSKLASKMKISNRTLGDWRCEKFSMSLGAVKVLLRMTKGKFPRRVKINNAYWYTKKGARAGGIATYRKYKGIGDSKYRKKMWREWWDREGRYKCNITAPKFFRKPRFSKELAEFVGIALGDGGIARYQVYVTLHDDEERYSKFVFSLIKKLFNVPVNIFYRKEDSTIRLVVSRKKLVDFCVQGLGLKIGHKIRQQVDIPFWVKVNKKYSKSCLRGLVDTDGCVFNHRYRVRGKYYNYKKISFTSHSKPLLESVFEILNRLGIKARITKSGKDIRIDSREAVKKYFEIVGFHNFKCLKKYQN